MKKVFIVLAVLYALFAVNPFISEPLSPGTGIRIGEFTTSRIVASASYGLQLVWVAGGLLAVGICILWANLSDTREKRTMLPTIPGVILLILGAYGIGPGMAEGFIQPIVLKARQVALGEVNPIMTILTKLVPACLALTGSYFLCFRKRKSIPTQGINDI